MQATVPLRTPVAGARARRPRIPGLVVVALAPIVLLAILVVVLLWISVQQGTVGTATAFYTLANYRTLLVDPYFLGVLVDTAIFAAATSVIALLVGLPIAWLAERSTMPGRSIVYVLMTMGILIPGLYVAMGWTFIAHPRIGFVNMWLQNAFGLNAPVLDVTSPLGMGIIQGLSYVPLTFVLAAQVFATMNPSLEEAAQIHGLGFFSTLRRVTLPLARPGILAALIYILTLAVATFDIPAVLGMGNRVYVLSTYLYLKNQPQGQFPPNYGITAALGACMIVVALVLTAWYGQVLRQGHRYQVLSGKGYRPTRVNVGRWAYLGWGLVILYVTLAVLLPLVMIAFAAFTPYLLPPTPAALKFLTLSNFQNLDMNLIKRGIVNTATLVVVVPVAVLFFGFCISWLVVRSRSRARYALEFAAFLPHALPEVILAISGSLFALFVVGKVAPLYGSVWLIALVYLLGRMAFATRSFNAALLQIHRELEEAAFVSGLSFVQTTRRVILPLLRPAVLSVWIWSLILVYREVTVAVFLVAQDNITLPAVVWSFWTAGGRSQAAAVTLVMIAVLIPLMAVFWWAGRRHDATTAV